MSAQKPVRIGFIGAGLFAQDAHVPAIKALGDTFTIAAICSRRSESAERLAQQIEYPVDTTTSIDDLLAREDIDAVNIVLPIPLIPEVVHKALDAGKHIISEKPVAPTVAIGREMLAHYAQTPDLVWMVAENFRYEPSLIELSNVVRSGELGRLITVQSNAFVQMAAENKYYHTAWRRENIFPGGFVLDGGVHHVALLRMALGEIITVSAATRQMRDDLPPIDTVSAALEFENGFIGSFNTTYAASSPWVYPLHVLGDKGALKLDNNAVTIRSESGERTLEFSERTGVELELAAFAAAIRDGAAHINSPQQALQDVAVIEAILESARSGQRVKVEQIV